MTDMSAHTGLSGAKGSSMRKRSNLTSISRTKLSVLARQLRMATSVKSGYLDIRSCKEVARKLEEAARQEAPPQPAASALPIHPLVVPRCAKCGEASAADGQDEGSSLANCDDATFEFFVRRQFGIKTPGAAGVLAMLIRSYDALCTAEQICKRIHCQDASLKVFVCQLRADLDKFGLSHHIVTVRKSQKNGDGGYFIAPEHQSKFTDLLASQILAGEYQ